MKYDEVRQKELREMGRRFAERAQERFQQRLDATEDARADFVCDILNETQKSELFRSLRADILSGMRPSVVIEAQLSWLFEGFIMPRRKECVLWVADRCRYWNYASEHVGRRSFRTQDPQVLFEQLKNLLGWFIWQDKVDADSLRLLRGELSEEEQGFLLQRRGALPPCQVAYEIDRGNADFIAEVRRIILGESEVDIDELLIRGVLQSANAELHELLGKLLLAARLQEGLRQAICENADMGTVEGFLCIMRVIHEHGLIRYSSVKRAFGVWTGLIANLYDARAADLERISEKTEAQAWQLLKDASARAAALETEDSMQIYLALWACGVYEAQDAAAHIRRFSERGTHHQLLTACYALRQFCEPHLSHPVAAELVARHDEQDVLAAAMPSFMPRVSSLVADAEHLHACLPKGQRPTLRLRDYFAGRAEAEASFERLLAIYSGIKGKAEEFKPCIFPWNSEKLEKEEIAERLCWLAAALQDNERIDRALDFLPDIGYLRKRYILLLLIAPQTEKQRRALVELVGDKQEDARRQAFALLRDMELSAEHYALAESMLRYKNADMRGMLMDLLLRQEDAALHACVERLLADRKEEKRTAGLDMVLRLGKDEARQPVYERCRRLVAACRFESSKEQLLAQQIVPAEAAEEEAAPLFDGTESYEPVLHTEYLAQGEELFGKYFPKRSLLDSLRGKAPDFEEGLQKVYYRENIVARIYARADWFSPSDIEAPTLEWVAFFDRRSNELLQLSSVPDVLFSEVMRDVDLAVSVAHAGGVDPETSHSTVEMRAALLRFTLSLFKIGNVEIVGSHAHICGTRADYTLHLGSGVVHQKGGTMLSILPVHSQHRGKLFLPFADDDPKTAETLSKALLLADDATLQDPTILRQLKR